MRRLILVGLLLLAGCRSNLIGPFAHRPTQRTDDPLLPVLTGLNEPVYVIPHNPTAENIARLIFEYAQEQGFPVVEVALWETQNSSAAYCEPLRQG